jgi:hypothetical protein
LEQHQGGSMELDNPIADEATRFEELARVGQGPDISKKLSDNYSPESIGTAMAELTKTKLSPADNSLNKIIGLIPMSYYFQKTENDE